MERVGGWVKRRFKLSSDRVRSKDIQEFLVKRKELQEIVAWMRQFRNSSQYREILHELVERAPGMFTINWGMVLRRDILD
jgi:hypothetical protein